MLSATVARWRSGLTHIPFKDTFMGSNPVRVTNLVNYWIVRFSFLFINFEKKI